jgi:S1-C subfamily serine protease
VLAFAANQADVLLPRGVTLPKGVEVPNDTAIAIYMPAAKLKSRSFVPGTGMWAEPGKALEESRSTVVAKLFPKVLPAGGGAAGSYGLLVAVQPDWNVDAGNLKLELRYRVYDPAGQMLREGVQVQVAGINASGTLGGFRAASYKAMQLLLVDILKELKPSAAQFPANGNLAEVPAARLLDKKKAVATGTGFVINKSGQLMTAAHVLRDCLLVEATREGQHFDATQKAASDLLDLAVLDTGRDLGPGLPLRVGQTLMLGESITNVGFPLQDLLSGTPNLTRGNVSARAGLKGSVGQFQFSAPIQPGSSGGPVVSDGGELLGITVSTLNVAALASRGLVPQNVNFALDAKHAAAFMRREGVEFVEVAPRANASMQVANEAALSSVVQLSCYQ